MVPVFTQFWSSCSLAFWNSNFSVAPSVVSCTSALWRLAAVARSHIHLDSPQIANCQCPDQRHRTSIAKLGLGRDSMILVPYRCSASHRTQGHRPPFLQEWKCFVLVVLWPCLVQGIKGDHWCSWELAVAWRCVNMAATLRGLTSRCSWFGIRLHLRSQVSVIDGIWIQRSWISLLLLEVLSERVISGSFSGTFGTTISLASMAETGRTCSGAARYSLAAIVVHTV